MPQRRVADIVVDRVLVLLPLPLAVFERIYGPSGRLSMKVKVRTIDSCFSGSSVSLHTTISLDR